MSASLLELGAGFHPEFTGRENVYLNGSIHGLKRAQIRELMDEIVAFAELERFVDLPVRTYSSGMYMRLGFAVAAHIQADVLLLDEVFAVGDEEFQRKCFGKIYEFKQRGGTIVFVSHDAASVERLCERAVLLRDGRVELRRLDAARRSRGTTSCSPTSATPRSAPPACASGEAARRGSSRRACSGRTARSGSSSPPASRSTVELRIVVREAVPPPRRLARAPRRGRAAARRRPARHR